MHSRSNTKTDRSLKLVLSVVLLTAALILQSVPPVHAATALLNRSDKMSDSTAGAVTTHVISFTFTDFVTSVGSVQIEFCSNDPIPESTCVPPNGFDASSANLISETGETGFTIHPNSDANNIILSRFPVLVTTADVEYEFDNIINPTDIGTFYIRLRSFESDDATGTAIQQGGIALSVNRQFNVSAEVPPFLRLCVAVTITGFDCDTAVNFFIDFGEFSTAEPRFASTEMVAATNAPFGYSISLSGTTLTSGTKTIPALGTQAVSSPGTSQFGINLRANTTPAVGAEAVGPGTAVASAGYNIPNRYRFVPSDTVVTTPGTNDYRKFTVSYLANISPDQAPGIYVTTITYICLANF